MNTYDFKSNYTDDPFEVNLSNEKDYVVSKLGLTKEEADNMEVTVSYCNVEWSFTIEMRSWGVKTLSAYATKISLELYVEYEVESKEPFGYKTKEHTIMVDFKEWEEINNTRDEDNDGMYSVNFVDIDFKDKSVGVEF
jgi:hypothetical protein